MSLTKVEQIALRMFAKTCDPKNECGAVLKGQNNHGFPEDESSERCCVDGNCVECLRGLTNYSARDTYRGVCDFDGCCLNCFLSGEIHRPEKGGNIIKCGEELHDYFNHNTILSDEYSLAGLSEEDVELAVVMLKAIRGGMEPGLAVEEFSHK